MPPAMVTGYPDYMLKSNMANQRGSENVQIFDFDGSESLQEKPMNSQETEEDEIDGTASGDASLQDNTDISSGDFNEISSQDFNEISSDDESEEWQDILGNGQLMKKILRAGWKQYKPMKGDLCKVNIKGHLESNTFEIVEHYRKLEIFVGEGDVVQGLDLVLVLMDLKEVARIKVHSRFAYGEKGNSDKVPPNANIIYTVELLSINSQFDMSDAYENLTWGYRKRSRGNWWFIRGEMHLALECYKKALSFTLATTDNFSDQRKTLAIVIHNNMAAAQLKLSMYQEALENIEYVLTHEPANKKALCRKALIFTDLGQFAEALQTYKVIKKLYPQMKDLESQIRKIAKKMLTITESQKNLYRKMLGIKPIEIDTIPEDIKTDMKNEGIEIKRDKNTIEMNKKIFWGLVGGTSAVICGIIVHKLIS